MRRQERQNPWGVNTNKKQPNIASITKNAEKKFLETKQKLSAAVEKHVTYDESSEEEELESDKILGMKYTIYYKNISQYILKINFRPGIKELFKHWWIITRSWKNRSIFERGFPIKCCSLFNLYMLR